jgi:hypothetical protein
MTQSPVNGSKRFWLWVIVHDLSLKAFSLQPIYLSTYKGKCHPGGGCSILESRVLPARGIEIIDGFVKSPSVPLRSGIALHLRRCSVQLKK